MDQMPPLDPNRRPHALMIPSSMKSGTRFADRVSSICDIAEPLLGLDRKKGQTAMVRFLPPAGEVCFVTGDINDTINFPKTHSRTDTPRYRWETQPNGIRFGFKVDGADDAE
jgi:hypothetical protein